MSTITRLTAADFDEAMDFLNLIFSAYQPHDFATMLPSIYRPTDEHMACNHAIRQNGRIRAMVGMFPITLRLGDVTVRVAGIGGVSTHPSCRGAGYMQTLMNHCVGRMKEEGYHLSWLGGQRQRYLYFGYESCGIKCGFTLSKTNLRHCFHDAPHIRFEAISADHHERVAKAVAIHDAQPVRCERPRNDFYRYLVGWRHSPYAALDSDGHMVGYLVADKKADFVAELCADSDDIAVRMMRAWVDQHSADSATIEAPAMPAPFFYAMGRLSERVRVRESGNWQVFDWVTVTDALMRLKRLGGPMVDGAVVVGVEGHDALRLQVDGEAAGCSATDAAPHITCDAPTALRLLFGPLAPSLVTPLPAAAAPLASWLPLPLSFPRQDWV